MIRKIAAAVIMLTVTAAYVETGKKPSADYSDQVGELYDHDRATGQKKIEMRPRPTDPKDFPEYIQYLVDVSRPRTAEERALDAAVQKKYEGAHNIDCPTSAPMEQIEVIV